jgi:hypothetical protein
MTTPAPQYRNGVELDSRFTKQHTIIGNPGVNQYVNKLPSKIAKANAKAKAEAEAKAKIILKKTDRVILGGYKESGRNVYLNGGSRANTVYYKGGGKEAYVRVGGGFVNLDKNYERNS